MQETIAKISQWYVWNTFNNRNISEIVDHNMIYGPADKCPTEYCAAQGYFGNTDLTGIGVS